MIRKIEGRGPFTQQAVFRVGIILATIIVVFGFLKWLAVPSTFGQYGRYRGDSISEATSLPINFAGGNQACGKCHQKDLNYISQGEHGTMDCQSCHGPAVEHIKNPAAGYTKVKGTAEFCGACHQKIAGRSKQDIATVTLQIHSGGVECVKCHDPHQPWARLGGSKI